VEALVALIKAIFQYLPEETGKNSDITQLLYPVSATGFETEALWTSARALATRPKRSVIKW
jgi:hypothetical protein